MLGKNIGTKVDANFFNTQYQAFLAQRSARKNVELVPAKAPTRKRKSKAQIRAEMRRKGIFVVADSDEFDNTIMEKPCVLLRPYIVPNRSRWKRHIKKVPKPKVPESTSTSGGESVSTETSTEEQPTKRDQKRYREGKKKPSKPKGREPSVGGGGSTGGGSSKKKKKQEKPKETKEPKESKETKEVKKPKEPKEESKDPKEPKDLKLQPKKEESATTIAKAKSPLVSPKAPPPEKPVKSAEQPPAGKPPSEQTTPAKPEQPTEKAPEKPSAPSEKPPTEQPPAQATASEQKVSEQPAPEPSGPSEKPPSEQPPAQPSASEQPTPEPPGRSENSPPPFVEPSSDQPPTPSESSEQPPAAAEEFKFPTSDEIPGQVGVEIPRKVMTLKREGKEDVYESLEEDVDLTKVLLDFNTENLEGVGAGDRNTLHAAQKILRVAYKEKAFEKTLTKTENDVLAKFFSGKIPYDANVLHVLDSVLDKTIDYFRTNKTKIDPEIQELIDKRETLKAAMLKTMLAKPKFLPTEWVKQYEAYQEEALKETTGINWARIFLLYPAHRSFDDGEADVFGNFTRARRSHWLWGVIFGPSDSKTFEEVDKENKSQMFYLDTAIIEDAKNKDTVTGSTTSEMDTQSLR